MVPWQSQSFSALPLWNCIPISITTTFLFSLGVLSGNRRFQPFILEAFALQMCSSTNTKLNVGLIYSLCQIFWNVNEKSYCILKVGLSQFIAAIGETQAVWNTTADWVSRTVKTDCTTGVNGSTWSLGNWWIYTGFDLFCNVTKSLAGGLLPWSEGRSRS